MPSYFMRRTTDSQALTSVMLSVMRGNDYSSQIARELDYTQAAANLNLQRMVKLKWVKTRKEGLIVRYNVEWKAVAAAFAEHLLKRYKQFSNPKNESATPEQAAIHYATKNAIEVKYSGKQTEAISFEMEGQISALKKDTDFIHYCEIFFIRAAKAEELESLSMSELFDRAIDIGALVYAGQPEFKGIKTPYLRLLANMADEQNRKRYALYSSVRVALGD